MLYGIDYGKFRETMVGHAGTRISCRVRGGAWRVGPSVRCTVGGRIADLDCSDLAFGVVVARSPGLVVWCERALNTGLPLLKAQGEGL